MTSKARATKKARATVSSAKVSAKAATAPAARAKASSKAVGSKSTARYALLIRGINVGTKNSLPMADLHTMLAELGATDVETYIQSGNAVFTSRVQEAELTRQVEARLTSYMGRPIGVTLRTEQELAQIVQGSPLASIATNPSYHSVTFLSHKPTSGELSPLREHDFSPERFEIVGREIYAWHPAGQGRSLLAQTLAKLKLRGTVTTRNFRTVTKLFEMLTAHRESSPT